MMKILFNPFENRTDRDVRNLLGRVFISALHKGDQAAVAQAVSDLGRKKLPDPAQSYIKARYDRYTAVLVQVSPNPLLGADIYATAGLLWVSTILCSGTLNCLCRKVIVCCLYSTGLSATAKID